HGGRAVGATLRLWIDPRAPDPEAACCSPDSVRRARATCHAAGLGHLSIDLRPEFARDVVVPFVTGYAQGETPNPCVTCNGRFRLDELVRLADVVGAREVATGHYARIVVRGGAALIQRGVDPTKDQSYMLAEVEPRTVARLRFPLGEEHKVDIRVEAEGRGLEQAAISESQEVCFLGGGDYRQFLKRAGAMGAPGEIVMGGEVVGTHDGIARFTPGQRKGIGVAHSSPLYVLDVNPQTGRVEVGPTGAPQLEEIALGQLRWHDPTTTPGHVTAQLRYRSRGGMPRARVVIEGLEAGVDAVLVLDAPERTPAPGQAAVLYDDDDVVVGTARILRRVPVEATAVTTVNSAPA
ncbi:MAG: thiouridylase, partial [Thermoleophilia bacterium]|nr:thiouridylase [Thermoleophilia bacterium]